MRAKAHSDESIKIKIHFSSPSRFDRPAPHAVKYFLILSKFNFEIINLNAKF